MNPNKALWEKGDSTRIAEGMRESGGRLVMWNGIAGDPALMAPIWKISSAYCPPPPEGFVRPMTWGVEENVIERFATAGVPEEQISFERDTYTFNFPRPPSAVVAEFK